MSAVGADGTAGLVELDAIALGAIRGVGAVRHAELVAQHGSATAALERFGRPARERARDDARRVMDDVARIGARVLVARTAAYPPPLLELPDPPPVLFALGDLSALGGPAVAIVGTRRASEHGLRAARRLAEAVARAGGTVVSGLALGIDGEAHGGALDAAATTIAVLGTGVDVVYPRAHSGLRARILERGLLLSELRPGDAADAGSFPRRNRIIAGLARVTVVVEAPHRSGALITAGHALDLGRSVAAVPGPIDVPSAAGTNQLLRDGAHVVCGADDLLMLAGLGPGASRTDPPPDDPLDRRVWELLGAGPADTDSVVAAANVPAAACLAALGRLELAGRVECTLTGQIVRRR